MSCAKQLPRTRSFSIVESGASVPQRHRIGQIRASRQTIPAVVLWLALETLGRFTSDVTFAIAEAAFAGLSWLFAEFLAGCAIYAEAMYPVQAMTMDHSDNSSDQAVPTPAPAATRPRLIVVSDTTRDTLRHELPKQATAAGRVAVPDRTPPDRTPWELEVVRSVRAPAARRKNRPR
jgi:hypothetical protein